MTELLSPGIPARVLLTSYGWLIASFDSANGVVTLEEFLNKIRGKCEKIKETEVVSALIEHSLISISLLREPDGRLVCISKSILLFNAFKCLFYDERKFF